MHIVNQNLKKLRLAAGYTQASFAELMGCTLKRIGSYEAGIALVPQDISKMAIDHFSIPKEFTYDFLWNPNLKIHNLVKKPKIKVGV